MSETEQAAGPDADPHEAPAAAVKQPEPAAVSPLAENIERAQARGADNQIERLRAAIVARLTERLPGRVTPIAAFDDAANNFDFQGLEAAVFVQYAGSQYSGDDTGPARIYAPARMLSWTIYALVRSLKGSEAGIISASALLEEIRLALQGQSFAGATPMRINADRLDAQIEGGWRYIMEFTNSCPAPAYMDERIARHGL